MAVIPHLFDRTSTLLEKMVLRGRIVFEENIVRERKNLSYREHGDFFHPGKTDH